MSFAVADLIVVGSATRNEKKIQWTRKLLSSALSATRCGKKVDNKHLYNAKLQSVDLFKLDAACPFTLPCRFNCLMSNAVDLMRRFKD